MPRIRNDELYRLTMLYIVQFKRMNQGRFPTFREIMEAMELSSTSVARYVVGDLVESGDLIQIKTESETVHRYDVPKGVWLLQDDLDEVRKKAETLDKLLGGEMRQHYVQIKIRKDTPKETKKALYVHERKTGFVEEGAYVTIHYAGVTSVQLTELGQLIPFESEMVVTLVKDE